MDNRQLQMNNLVRDLNYMRHNLEQTENDLKGQENYAKYFIYPRLQKAKRYIPETGEELIDHEEYSSAMAKLTDHIKRCERLEECIEDSILNIQVQERMISELDQEIFVSKIKAQKDKELAEQFFSVPVQKGTFIQQKLF